MSRLNLSQRGEMIVVTIDGQPRLEVGWKLSLEICKALDLHIRNAEARHTDPAVLVLPETGIKQGSTEFTFRQELDKILCIANGQLLFDMNTTPTANGISIARHVWRAWLGVTKVVEEENLPRKDRERLQRDAAIFHRSGAPFGLTNNPKHQAEAKKLAEGDRELRRHMANGIKSAEVLGAPSIKQDNRSPLECALELAGSLTPAQLARIKADLQKGP